MNSEMTFYGQRGNPTKLGMPSACMTIIFLLSQLPCLQSFCCRGHCKSWTLDCGLAHGLDYGLRFGLHFGLNFGLLSNRSGHNSVKDELTGLWTWIMLVDCENESSN